MKLLTKSIEQKLLANGAANAEGGDTTDFKPVVKYFNPVGAATWLISEMSEDGILFGLADLGLGYPEMGSISLRELESIKLSFGLGIERDLRFQADKTLTEYAAEARELGRITA